MTVRKRKKKNKLRGHRTHGKGDTKNKRGAGSRGGRGRAGSHKHKFTKYFGEFGQDKKKITGKPLGPSLNLDQIDAALPKWMEQKKVVKEGTNIVVDGKKLGFVKIIGRGQLDSKVVFENVKVSKKALEKLEKSGSTVKGIEAKEETEIEEEKVEGE